MPGLSVLMGDVGCASDVVGTIQRVVRPFDRVERLFETGSLDVLFSAYEGYPRKVVESPIGIAILEGTLLNVAQDLIEADLLQLIARLAESKEAGSDAAQEWARQADGDFVLVLFSYVTRTVLAVNDTMGRLPVYVRKTPRGVMISREIKILVALGGPGKVAKRSIAHVLLFGFPLGRRTIIDDIDYLPPGTVLTVSLHPYECHALQYVQWRFDEFGRQSRSKTASLADLAACFEATCRAQAGVPGLSPIMLQLSGGLDSRSVAAGLTAAGVEFLATSFTTADGVYDRDVVIAQDVARILNVPWRCWNLGAPASEALQQAALLRDGLNYSGMASRLEYLHAIRAQFGTRVMCFTGDGGDKALPDLRAPWWVTSLDDFVEYRLHDAIFSLDSVSRMLDIDAAALHDEIREYFKAYPERDTRTKETHFLIMERAWGWLLEGEERNRSYAWHQTPFYGHRFFKLAMAIHPDEKRHYALYRRFLQSLNAQTAALPNAGWNMPLGGLNDIRHDIKGWVRSQIPSHLRKSFRHLRPTFGQARHSVDSRLKPERKIAASLLQDERVKDVFRGRDVAPTMEACSDTQLYYLLTQMIYIAHTWGTPAAVLHP